MGAFGNGEFGFAIDGGDFDFGAQNGIENRDGEGIDYVIVTAFENGVREEVYGEIEIAAWAATSAAVSFACHSQGFACIDAVREVYGDFLGFAFGSVPAAIGAGGFDDFALATALSASGDGGERA